MRARFVLDMKRSASSDCGIAVNHVVCAVEHDKRDVSQTALVMCLR
jgi:hypothetical protein